MKDEWDLQHHLKLDIIVEYTILTLTQPSSSALGQTIGIGVLMDMDLRAALHAAIAVLGAEGQAGVADPLRRLVA